MIPNNVTTGPKRSFMHRAAGVRFEPIADCGEKLSGKATPKRVDLPMGLPFDAKWHELLPLLDSKHASIAGHRRQPIFRELFRFDLGSSS
jgi:hypothetical protein